MSTKGTRPTGAEVIMTLTETVEVGAVYGGGTAHPLQVALDMVAEHWMTTALIGHAPAVVEFTWEGVRHTLKRRVES